ncbi:uncharacterized protein GGS22DRAFT_189860 [Annulohypoxylon maeteangense]|uniref:uncharacterized protein n=1 Tax=Annulohypoxylon maeteangense TaxID=1927788 RepID=UPI002008EAD4|nr:uncharacterized protein GGS22DRAFT_189860 [Annulohypoxylon maeteangense]KAI0883890.1 hypothetical protein GGS22DRAFT_189860 [Annulohypoxylon maeteangense]
MTSITPKVKGIELLLPRGFSEQLLFEFSPFKNWLSTLFSSLVKQANPSHPFNKDPYRLRSVEIQSFDLFGKPPNQRIGFLKFIAGISNGAGETLPGSVFIRGPSVAMLVILVPDDVSKEDNDKDGLWGERYALLTVQPRIAAGSLAFVELPAGMVEEGGSFSGTAAREIREELGLEIPADQLRCLSDMAGAPGVNGEDLPLGMYPSAGGCDEHIPIYMHERRVPRETLGEWAGKLTGLRSEGEKITLKLVKMRDLWREGARDAKCLAALALWQEFRRQGKV